MRKKGVVHWLTSICPQLLRPMIGGEKTPHTKRKLLLPGAFAGKGWPRQSEGEGEGREGAMENRPPGSGALKG